MKEHQSNIEYIVLVTHALLAAYQKPLHACVKGACITVKGCHLHILAYPCILMSGLVAPVTINLVFHQYGM